LQQFPYGEAFKTPQRCPPVAPEGPAIGHLFAVNMSL
jgi:hypothetical protein